MNTINNHNNSQIDFTSRLYLKNIKKNDIAFAKEIAKDFKNATKNLEGKSFTLEGKADGFELSSNQSGSRVLIPRGEKEKPSFLDQLTNIAVFLRKLDILSGATNKKEYQKNISATCTFEMFPSKLEEATEYLDKEIKKSST